MAFKSKHFAACGAPVDPELIAGNVVSIDSAKKQQGENKEKKGKAKEPKPPTVEDRFSGYAHFKSFYVLGRQAMGEEPDMTLYSWMQDEQGSRWQRQVDKLVRGKTCAWLRQYSPGDVTGARVGSCIQVLRDVLIEKQCTLPLAPLDVDVVPLRNAYLLIEKSGPDKGRIRAVKPCKSYGQIHAIQADLDWSRVAADGTYTPSQPTQGGYWHGYLASTFPDAKVYALAQEALSMALLSTCYEKAVWMYGGGENGKSCMLHILRSLSPSATAAISISRLARNEFGNNQLISKRIAICSEMPKVLTAEIQEILKGLVSRDPTQAEFKGQDAFTFIPEATFFFATNHHPIMPDHEHGWWRKVVTLPFLHRIKKEQKIQGLHKLITDNPAEMIQVIDWMLIGAVSLTRRGHFMPDDELPEQVRDLTLAQRLVSDPVAAWIHECDPQYDEGAWSSKEAIYKHFSDFTESEGRRPVAANAFWLRVAEHFREDQLNTSGEQIQVDGKRRRHVQLLVPDIKPTRHVIVPTKAQMAQAAKNPPETHYGTDTSNTLPGAE